jgi:hypothetical protein
MWVKTGVDTGVGIHHFYRYLNMDRYLLPYRSEFVSITKYDFFPIAKLGITIYIPSL